MIKKQFLKTKPEANVTFNLPKEAASGAAKVALVGDFNDWDTTATEMKKLKTGAFKATIKLETGKEYQFRYLIDGWYFKCFHNNGKLVINYATTAAWG